MKLAMVIFRYFPYGGLQRDMLAIAMAAHARGHQVSIFCGEWQGTKPSGPTIIEIKKRGLFNVAGVKLFIDAFLAETDFRQFDLVLGFNKMPGLDVYYCGDSCFAKKAREERGWWYRLTPRARLYLACEAAVYSHLSGTRILDLSPVERPVFAKYYGTIPERQTLLPPGVDRGLYRPLIERQRARQKIREELAMDTQAPLILCVGSGFKTKGLDRSLRSFAEVKKQFSKARLAVVGSGDPGPFLRLVQHLGLSDAVSFLGGRQDMADIYAAGDLLLHPAYREVAGNVILEAMLSAVPVLATQDCGYAHYPVGYQLGEILQAPDNAVTTAEQISKLLAVDPRMWCERAEKFACSADVFARPERAVDALESMAVTSPEVPLLGKTDQAEWVLCDELIPAWQNEDLFTLLETMPGVPVREMRDRQTLRFSLNGRTYYRKWHRGVGWGEILKNLLRWRWPVLGAATEWEALTKLRALELPSVQAVAYGRRGKNPAHQQSFIVTRELADVVQLDHFWAQHPVMIKHKRLIFRQLAVMARRLHAAGINHRDFYLCHFMLAPASLAAGALPEIYMMDLHRAQCRTSVPTRWLIKDLAALYFSSMDLGFGQRDILRFLRTYFDCDTRTLLETKSTLLRKIERRACKMYQRDFGRSPETR